MTIHIKNVGTIIFSLYYDGFFFFSELESKTELYFYYFILI